MQNTNSQTDLKTVKSGSHETVMFIDTYITQSELNVLCDTGFSYTDDSNDVKDNSVVLSTLITRIQNSAHYCSDNLVEDEKTFTLRCPITDLEMEVLNEAGKKMNPLSSSSLINKIQNSIEPVEQLYHIEINISLEFKTKFLNQHNNSLHILANNTTFNVIGKKNTKRRYKLDTYIKKEEYESLVKLSDDKTISDEIREFCEVIPQITTKFNFNEERKEYLNEVNIN